MAKKQKKSAKKKGEIKGTPTKRQLSKWQRQKKIQRIIIISGSVFFLLVIAIVGYGFYQEQIKPFHEPVLKVNDTVFNTKYYLKMVELYTEGLERTQGATMAQMVLSAIMQNALINQHAQELGASVSKSEVDDGLVERGLPTIKPYEDAYGAELLTEKLLAGYFDEQVPATDEQVKIQAMIVATYNEAEEIIERLKNGESFSSLAEENSIEDITKEKGGDLGWIPEGLFDKVYPDLSDSSLDTIAFSLNPGEISEPKNDPSLSKDGGFWILEVTEKDDDNSCHVRGILVGSNEEANDIREKLLNGEDFALLAESVSQDTVSSEYGGDLGWVQKGYGNEIITNAAFDMEAGDISEPVYDDSVKTTGGYWIVKVLEKDAERPIDDNIRDQLKQEKFTAWLEEHRQSDTIEQFLTEEQIQWALNQIY